MRGIRKHPHRINGSEALSSRLTRLCSEGSTSRSKKEASCFVMHRVWLWIVLTTAASSTHGLRRVTRANPEQSKVDATRQHLGPQVASLPEQVPSRIKAQAACRMALIQTAIVMTSKPRRLPHWRQQRRQAPRISKWPA